MSNDAPSWASDPPTLTGDQFIHESEDPQQRPSERLPPSAVQVVQISDLHLNLLPPDAKYRQLCQAVGAPRATAAFVQRIREVVADGNTVNRLWHLLTLIAEQAAGGPPTVIVQTGDIEAFGRSGNGRWSGYDAMEAVWAGITATVPVINMYGNHDIWPPPGAFLSVPVVHRNAAGDLANAHPRVRGPYVGSPVGSAPVHVHRVNTVNSGVFTGAVLALGRIELEPVAPGAQAVPAIVRLRSLPPGAVHVVLTHHPLLAVGGRHAVVLGDVAPIRRLLAGHIVLSGHTHVLWPTDGSMFFGPRQFVAPSATVPKRSHFLGRPDQDPGVVVYIIDPDDASAPVAPRIDRSWFRYVGGAYDTSPSPT